MKHALTKLGRIAPIVGAVLLLAAPCAAVARTGQVELGTAVGGPPFGNNPTYRGVLELYDSLTAENDMKMYYQRPSQETFDFAVGDAITAFAEAHGQKMHGHTLVLVQRLRESRLASQPQLDPRTAVAGARRAHHHGRVSLPWARLLVGGRQRGTR